MRAILWAALWVGCATAGEPAHQTGAGDAATLDGSHKPIDAPRGVPTDGPSSHHDAAVMPDAPPDAFVSHGHDASTSGTICHGNSDCTTTGECCVTLGGAGLCSHGQLIGNTCIPQ